MNTKRKRTLRALRWLINGRNYGALIGKTEPAPGLYRSIGFEQYKVLLAFKVTSLRVDHERLAHWLVWSSDLIELQAPLWAVIRWVVTGEAYCEART